MLGYYLDLALRSLKRNKVLTALMVLAIAVGIGASMTTLTVMHLLSGDPLPGRSGTLFYPQVDPDPDPSPNHQPYDMMDYRSAQELWSAHRADREAMVTSSQLRLTVPQVNLPPLMAQMLSTTSDFFPMFNVPFRYGSGWTAQDDHSRARVAVISSDLNDKLFNGADSVGRTLRLKDSDVRIVGVLAPWRPSPQFYAVAGGRFSNGDTAGFYNRPEDVFVPFQSSLEINAGGFQPFTCWSMPGDPAHLQTSPCVWVALWAQLDSAAKVADYRRFVAGYAAQQKAMGRFAHADNTQLRSLMGWLDFNQVVPSDVRLQTWLALAFLLICLFNTVGLLLAKFLRRAGEIGVRRALGASRAAVFAQCLVEAGLIGLLGGVGGLLLTLFGLWLVRRQPVEYADLVHLDTTMFLTTFALAIAASLLAGVLPALRASRMPPSLQLKTL
ncbi:MULTISPECIES: ABC transporter permease [Rhodanobacter]|uniref:ABC transporter permease n=1 Tax=Rhodanobacter TaxID=75309 RepID=UPI000260C7DD|nr:MULTISPECIES: ABC transporter permease [Rhodanobacter]EIM04767.1 ABC transporter permease [Rhodanobacter denitrificans]KZC21303.1 ABC transporter ATP-binding protein [Rhodanobacter denitrificans]UJJ51878.1 ABC transporter permease [Rhodanobacter denitrificans]UJM89809.1 ABC transporter permease [Rhodanobacter denitrificans]UJM94622.1 ABC transporter permease [Rhodanobacter denitrificans]